ncbi:MAG TPA: molybdate ABC transporter substrate-binding protein [Euzebyales bacterium]|nr:molybdate ABC transporter substrate-binding protein [Euzebyales bacterium]
MRIRIVLGVLLAVVGAACGGGQAAPSEAASPSVAATSSEALSGALTVFAAASLTGAFEAAAEQFEQAHPHVSVAFNFASSSTLATQIVEGAPADVFASANQPQMDVVEDAGLVAERTDLAGNSLQIAVEPGNPKGIDGLQDLARDDVTVVLAAEEVPAGEYGREALDAQDIDVEPASLETDVRAVLSRVALGEADAGVVYTSDIASAGADVEGVDIAAGQNVPATYPIAPLVDAPNPAAAGAFIDYVTSDDGQELLNEFGFSPP